jgi:hypothetical protein
LRSIDPALSDLGKARSVRVLYALAAALPNSNRNILRARAIPLEATVALEALQG